MIRAGLLALLLTAATAAPAGACPPPSDTLLFHSCWGAADARAMLLPEDGTPEVLPGVRRSLVVTGSYTGSDLREGGRPKPVGLFIHAGRVVNPNLARMDGVLILTDDGLSLQHRKRVDFGGTRHDLTDLDQRRAFHAAAAEAGVSVLQSHLLVIDGETDVSPSDDAPRFTRRLLFTDEHGWGVYQTDGAVTLHQAAEAVRRSRGARMAFNLDMGSYDYCLLRTDDSRVETCGFRGRDDLDRLSNLLVFALD